MLCEFSHQLFFFGQTRNFTYCAKRGRRCLKARPKNRAGYYGFFSGPIRRAFFARQETNDKVSINAFSDNCRIFRCFRVLVSTNEHSQIVVTGKSILVVRCFSSISFLLCCSRTWQKPMISDSNLRSQAEYSISIIYHHTGCCTFVRHHRNMVANVCIMH